MWKYFIKGITGNNFIKLNSSLFERLGCLDFRDCPRNSKRKGKLLNTIVDFEISNFLKEGKTFNLGDGKFSGIPKMGIIPNS